MSHSLNYAQEMVIKSLIRLTNKKLHYFAEDGLQDFAGIGDEFYFTESLVMQKLKLSYQLALASLDDLEDLSIVKRSTDSNGRSVFCLSDINKRLARFEAKQAEK